MDGVGSLSLLDMLHALGGRCAISYTKRCIDSADLNVHKRPGLAQFVEPIAQNLYAQISAANSIYDAVIGIPTGGNAWAKGIAKIASGRQEQEVPCLEFEKRSSYDFRVPEACAVPVGARLLVVDDTVFHGHAARAAIKSLTSAGYLISGFAFPVDIGGVGSKSLRDKGHPVFSTFNDSFVKKSKVRSNFWLR